MVGFLNRNTDDANVVTTLAHEPRTHLEQYLAYYVGREEPGYAVLVTGAWGTGKTHQVTKALPADRAYYVSLFGLNSTEEIEAQVFAQMFPKQASLKKFTDRLSTLNLGVPGVGSLGVNGLTSVLASTFIKNAVDTSKPLIFDDLERCSVDNKKILGIINRYVEHHKCRVIVIAHDAKVVEDFNDAKEKVFGQTIAVEPNVDEAFEVFNALFRPHGAPDTLADLKGEIVSIFKESGAHSLRVLRHVVEDVRRLATQLDQTHLQNHTAMVDLIRLFSALAIEYRTNALSKPDLKDRRNTVRGYELNAAGKGTPAEPGPFVKAASKYKSVDLTSTLLNDRVLADMLVDGRFDPVLIRESLNASAYFLEKETAPPWQIVGGFDKLDDSVVTPAVDRMNEQFTKREVTESGELLHIVALKMMMATKQLTSETTREVADAAKHYIDDLLNSGRLPPRTPGLRWFEPFNGSYAGISYWMEESYKDAFQEVFDHLIAARGKALEQTFSDRIPALLEVVRTDGQKFFEQVCHTYDGTIEYDDIPILASVSATDFVDAWLASPKSGWYWIGRALQERNTATGSYPALQPEAAWFPEVVTEMMRRATNETGLTRLRIARAAALVGVQSVATATP